LVKKIPLWHGLATEFLYNECSRNKEAKKYTQSRGKTTGYTRLRLMTLMEGRSRMIQQSMYDSE